VKVAEEQVTTIQVPAKAEAIQVAVLKANGQKIIPVQAEAELKEQQVITNTVVKVETVLL
jgi:hypothetical protein